MTQAPPLAGPAAAALGAADGSVPRDGSPQAKLGPKIHVEVRTTPQPHPAGTDLTITASIPDDQTNSPIRCDTGLAAPR